MAQLRFTWSYLFSQESQTYIILQIIEIEETELRCSCPNCEIRKNDKNSRIQSHNCHFAGCQKIFHKVRTLQAHIRWHNGKKPYMCPWTDCNKGYGHYNDLQVRIFAGLLATNPNNILSYFVSNLLIIIMRCIFSLRVIFTHQLSYD